MILMTWTLDFLRDMNVPQQVLLLFARARCMTIRHRHKNWKTTSNFAWIGKTRFLTGTGRRGRRAADSAARQRLVLTSCRQGRLTGLGLLTLQKRWSTKLQSHLKNSNNVKTASQMYLLHKLFIPIKIRTLYWVIFWRCEENQNYFFHLLDFFCLKILQRILEELKFLIWKPW